MDRDDFRSFALLLAACAEVYGKPMSEAAVALWWQDLEDKPLSSVQAAFAAWRRTPDGGQWMPKPADVIRMIDGGGNDRALIAWGRVFAAMSDFGAYVSVDFGDQAIHAAIRDMGGWAAVCRTENKALPFEQRRFCDAYRAYSSRPHDGLPTVLLGDHANANARIEGWKEPPPVMIGERQKQLKHEERT